MNQPKVAELTPSEAQARVHFAFEDDLAAYRIFPSINGPLASSSSSLIYSASNVPHTKKSNSENQEVIGVQGVTKLGCSHGWGMIIGAYQDERTVERRNSGEKFRRSFSTGH